MSLSLKPTSCRGHAGEARHSPLLRASSESPLATSPLTLAPFLASMRISEER